MFLAHNLFYGLFLLVIGTGLPFDAPHRTALSSILKLELEPELQAENRRSLAGCCAGG
jgi:hypothetical protein